MYSLAKSILKQNKKNKSKMIEKVMPKKKKKKKKTYQRRDLILIIYALHFSLEIRRMHLNLACFRLDPLLTLLGCAH